MMSIVWQLIVGLIVGVIARFLMHGKEAFPEGALGWLLTALLGVGGAFIGGVVARTLWAEESYTAGWIMSILGSLLLLFIVRLIFRKGSGTP